MSFHLTRNEHRALLLSVDYLLLNLAIGLALRLWARRGGIPFDLGFLTDNRYWLLLPVGWVIASALAHAYRLRIARSPRASLTRLAAVGGAFLAGVLTIYYFLPPQTLPRSVPMSFVLFAVLLLGGWRVVHARLSRHEALRRRAILLGSGIVAREVARLIETAPEAQYDLLGVVEDPEAGRVPVIHFQERDELSSAAANDLPPLELPVLGKYRDLVDILREHEATEVILAKDTGLTPEAFQAVLEAKERGLRIVPMPLVYEEVAGQVPVRHIGDDWHVALPLSHAAGSGLYAIGKRALDLVVACVGLTLFGLLLPFVAVAIYLESPGPIFYRQQRVGRGGSTFTVTKLRSMVPDAEKSGAVWAAKDDPRITRVGRLLRKTRLDEFPQFFNILKGEMSAVGPRPERPEFVEELAGQIPFYRLRHAVKPGMAGWAMIHQSYAGNVEDILIRLQYDLFYVKNASLWLDITILWRTLGEMLRLRGR